MVRLGVVDWEGKGKVGVEGERKVILTVAR